MQGINLCMLPLLDRVRNQAGLFMGVRLMVLRRLENLKGLVDGFSLGMRVARWHSEILHVSKIKKPLISKGFLIKNRRLAAAFDIQAQYA